jgi:hypothetical protein
MASALQLPVIETSVESPSGAVFYSSGEAIEGDRVEFRLLYSGNQLVSNGDATHKQTIRRAFHPQLKQLWKSNSQLRRLATQWGTLALSRHDTDARGEDISERAQHAYFAEQGRLYERGGFHFVPLVEQEVCARVSLDILFLRPDQHPLIKEGGDLDNRLKTLFDALRVPETTAGLGQRPEDGEDPFFVLLQDDSLISEIRVNTDNLLMLPQQRALTPKDAFLVIDVKLKPTERNPKSWAYE